jgi:hypothetical protein
MDEWTPQRVKVLVDGGLVKSAHADNLRAALACLRPHKVNAGDRRLRRAIQDELTEREDLGLDSAHPKPRPRDDPPDDDDVVPEPPPPASDAEDDKPPRRSPISLDDFFETEDDNFFQTETIKIAAIGNPADLKEQMKVFKRRQMDSAVHAALLGVCVEYAYDRDWVPHTKAGQKAYYKKEWGYGVTQINGFRRLAKNWKATRLAQKILLQHAPTLSDDLKLPEAGTVSFAEKALKFADALEKASGYLDPDEAIIAAEQTLRPKPKDPTADASITTRYHRLLALFAVVMAERPEAEDEVLKPLVSSIALNTMDNLDHWLKCEADEALDAFYEEQHAWENFALDPPWLEKPISKRAKPKPEPETVPRDDGERDAPAPPPDPAPKPEPGREVVVWVAPREPDRRDISRLQNMGWQIADIAAKYGISEAAIERSVDARPTDPPLSIDQAILAIYALKEHTCESVGDVLARVPIDEWDEDTRRSVSEELWQRTAPALWDDSERVQLVEAYFQYGPAILVYATDTEVLEFDDELGLQIISWEHIEMSMAPHIEEQRKRDQQRQRQDEGKAILNSKLPKVRKLKTMHERIERLRELKVTMKADEGQQAIDYIRAMKTDDPDFAACETFKDYLQHAIRRLAE